MLKLTDKASWEAVYNYVMDPLCDNKEDDKKWKRVIKEAKEEQASRKKSSGRRLSGAKDGGYRIDGFGSYYRYGGSCGGGFGGLRRQVGSSYSGGRRLVNRGSITACWLEGQIS